MTKQQLRKVYKQKRSQLSPNEMHRMNDLLLIQFQQWPLEDIQTVLSYCPITKKREVNTDLMVDYLFFRVPGLQLAFPVIDFSEHIFKALAVNNNTEYIINEYGITEPVSDEEIPATDIDAVFIPLLAFDHKGFRVGYGKGFYDRFLLNCRNDVLKIGFSWFEAEPAIDDINDFDVPLNICITPNKIYEF